MRTQQPRAGIVPSRPATALAVLLCLAMGLTLDLFACLAAADDLPPRARSCIAFIGASSAHAQVRVRPTSAHRMPQPAVLHTSAHRAEACSHHALLSFVSPLRNRQRLVQLAILRI